MRIDSAGMPVPDPPITPRDPLWMCPLCAQATWPHTNPDGHPEATICVRCRIVLEETT
jgi:hypothetical protein